MKDIHLVDIKESHLLGEWKVHRRTINKSDPAHIFAVADFHSFLNNGNYMIINGHETPGTWNIKNENDIIKNPIISISVNDAFLQGIITRLTCTDNCNEGKLTLYFSTGLELVLIKKSMQ